MRNVILAALIAVAPIAARATDERVAIDAAIDLCLATRTPLAICYMKHSKEEHAVSNARAVMRDCATEAGQRVQDCPAILAYIKQRWGY
jgi:hypothetical protein